MNTYDSFALQLREAFERACAATGADDLDEFVSAYVEARRENEALYARVAELAREADALREALVRFIGFQYPMKSKLSLQVFANCRLRNGARPQLRARNLRRRAGSAPPSLPRWT